MIHIAPRLVTRLVTVALLPLAAILQSATASTRPWTTDTDARAIRERVAALVDGIPDRYPGSAGNLAAEARVAGAFATSGFTNGAVEFSAACFVPGQTKLTLPDGQELRLLPMHPNLFRPGNFRGRSLDLDAVYLEPQDAGPRAVRPAHHFGEELRGTLVVQEFSGGAYHLIPYGPEGFVFIGGETHSAADAGGKLDGKELRVPRFYLDPEAGAHLRDALKAAGGRLRVHVDAEPSRWENHILRDPWVLIPGSNPALERDVVLVIAPLDSNAIVPELAAGGVAAANLDLLLSLLNQARANPPERSLLLVAVNARTQSYRGDRALAWHLLAPAARVEALQDQVAHDLQVQELMVNYYRRLQLDPKHPELDERFVEELRTLTDESLGTSLSIKDPIVRAARRDVSRIREAQLAISRGNTNLSSRLPTTYESLEQERQQVARILTLFNKFGRHPPLSQLAVESPRSLDILRGYVDDIIKQNAEWAELNRLELARGTRNGAIREALGGRRVALALSLEFDWFGDRIGFCTGDEWSMPGSGAARFGRNTLDLSERIPDVAEGRHPNLLVDTLTRAGGLSEGYYFPGQSFAGAIDSYQKTESTPAFALRNVFGSRPTAFSPDDTPANLNYTNVATIDAYTIRFLDTLLADPRITSPSELFALTGGRKSLKTLVWSGRILTHTFDEFSADVLPTLPVPRCAVTIRSQLSWPGIDPQGNVMQSFDLTDARAQVTIYGLPWDVDKGMLLCDAFHHDADFVDVDYAVDAGDVHQRVTSKLVRDTDISKTLALFPCREFTILDRSDTSLAGSSSIIAKDYVILSATRNAAPHKYGFYGLSCLSSSKGESTFATISGPGTFYVEPNERIKIVTRQKRAAIHATAEQPRGTGYFTPDEMGTGFFEAVARDLACLTRSRLDRMQGVSDELARDFLQRGQNALAAMDRAILAGDDKEIGRQRALALGAETKAYEQTAALTNDMLKAVVCYLALLLPFAFFLQKLLFRTVRVEAQMGWFALIFVATFAVFRLIHPAFRVAQSPEAMFVAFVMGSLALFVIHVLHRRFEGEMQLLFQTYTAMDVAEVTHSTAGQQALLIGVQNMKRRRMRTALTTATIVLVTFTMLSFSSITKRVSPTVLHRGNVSPYTGIFYHWPGQPMDWPTVNTFLTLFAGRSEVLQRSWLLSPRKTEGTKLIRRPMALHAFPSGAEAHLDAVLGLQSAEDGFLGPIPLLPGGRFFSEDNAREVILPESVARQLHIESDQLAGARVRFQGGDYAVVGILDEARFAALHDLDGKSLLPLQVRWRATDQDNAAMRDDLEEDSAAGVESVSTAALMLMPQNTALSQGASIYSLSIRFPEDATLWAWVEDLLTATQARFYLGSRHLFSTGSGKGRDIDAGVYYIGSGYRTSIGGLAVLIIPLLIASTIILNTMLGSVYERKAEIAVYNAVGLNPTHIGMFFLAEAFVYGVLGSVGGYLIGQVLTLTLNHFHLIPGLNVNFSSLSVVYVIAFTIAVVLLSTIYPARVATRTAVPSGKRKWSLPHHDGQIMHVAFPFIYQGDLVPGLLHYVAAYFARFSDVSLGDLLATPGERTRDQDAAGRISYRMTYHIALAPFDLGVTQQVVLQAAFDEQVDCYRIVMHIERLSGQDTNWASTNRPFLERLRQHLMRWRNLDRVVHEKHVASGLEWFGDPAWR